MKVSSVPSKALRDARQIGRPTALQAVQDADARRQADLSRRVASLPAQRPYILWTGDDNRTRRYPTIDAAMAAGTGYECAHVGGAVGDQWDPVGLIRDGVGWHSVSLVDRDDFDCFLGLSEDDAHAA